MDNVYFGGGDEILIELMMNTTVGSLPKALRAFVKTQGFPYEDLRRIVNNDTRPVQVGSSKGTLTYLPHGTIASRRLLPDSHWSGLQSINLTRSQLYVNHYGAWEYHNPSKWNKLISDKYLALKEDAIDIAANFPDEAD